MSRATNALPFLIRANEEAVFRDSQVVATGNLVTVLSMLLAFVTFLVVVAPPSTCRAACSSSRSPSSACSSRPTPPAPLHFGRSGSTFAVLRVHGRGRRSCSPRVCMIPRRRHPYLPIALALAATVGLHLGDLVAGARLELNTVFGYSATVGIRVSGEGNPTFSQLDGRGDPALRAVRLATARTAQRLCRRRPAGDHAARDGRAAVGKRLRRRPRRRAGLRPVRLVAARAPDPRGARSGSSPRSWW